MPGVLSPNDEEALRLPETAGLIRRVRRGDEEAASELVAGCQGQVLRLCRYLMKSREDAEDAAQEALLRFLRYLDRFDEHRPISPYLYRLTVNTCRELQRRESARRKLVVDRKDGVEEETVVDTKANGEQIMEGNEQRALLRRALGALTRRQRTALVLRDLEGLSTREVATIMGASAVTIRVHIAAARQRIRRFWREHEGGEH